MTPERAPQMLGALGALIDGTHLAQPHQLPRVIDEAFSGNAVPRFAAAATDGYRALFSRIVAIAPPPIGVGPP